jgi:hypothetical protein
MSGRSTYAAGFSTVSTARGGVPVSMSPRAKARSDSASSPVTAATSRGVEVVLAELEPQAARGPIRAAPASSKVQAAQSGLPVELGLALGVSTQSSGGRAPREGWAGAGARGEARQP